MKLDDWMKENRWTTTEFAKKMDRNKATISQVRNGKARPGKELIARITEFTEGKVTEADLERENDAVGV